MAYGNLHRALRVAAQPHPHGGRVAALGRRIAVGVERHRHRRGVVVDNRQRRALHRQLGADRRPADGHRLIRFILGVVHRRQREVRMTAGGAGRDRHLEVRHRREVGRPRGPGADRHQHVGRRGARRLVQRRGRRQRLPGRPHALRHGLRIHRQGHPGRCRFVVVHRHRHVAGPHRGVEPAAHRVLDGGRVGLGVVVLPGAHGHRLPGAPITGGERQAGRRYRDLRRQSGRPRHRRRHRDVLGRLRIQHHRVGGAAALLHLQRRRMHRNPPGVVVEDGAGRRQRLLSAGQVSLLRAAQRQREGLVRLVDAVVGNRHADRPGIRAVGGEGQRAGGRRIVRTRLRRAVRGGVSHRHGVAARHAQAHREGDRAGALGRARIRHAQRRRVVLGDSHRHRRGGLAFVIAAAHRVRQRHRVVRHRVLVLVGADGHRLLTVPVVRGERQGRLIHRQVGVLRHVHRHLHVGRRLRGQDHRVGDAAALVHRQLRRMHDHPAPVVVGDRALGLALGGVDADLASDSGRPQLDDEGLVLLVQIVVVQRHRNGRAGLLRREAHDLLAAPQLLVVGAGRGGPLFLEEDLQVRDRVARRATEHHVELVDVFALVHPSRSRGLDRRHRLVDTTRVVHDFHHRPPYRQLGVARIAELDAKAFARLVEVVGEDGDGNGLHGLPRREPQGAGDGRVVAPRRRAHVLLGHRITGGEVHKHGLAALLGEGDRQIQGVALRHLGFLVEGQLLRGLVEQAHARLVGPGLAIGGRGLHHRQAGVDVGLRDRVRRRLAVDAGLFRGERRATAGHGAELLAADGHRSGGADVAGVGNRKGDLGLIAHGGEGPGLAGDQKQAMLLVVFVDAHVHRWHRHRVAAIVCATRRVRQRDHGFVERVIVVRRAHRDPLRGAPVVRGERQGRLIHRQVGVLRHVHRHRHVVGRLRVQHHVVACLRAFGDRQRARRDGDAALVVVPHQHFVGGPVIRPYLGFAGWDEPIEFQIMVIFIHVVVRRLPATGHRGHVAAEGHVPFRDKP